MKRDLSGRYGNSFREMMWKLPLGRLFCAFGAHLPNRSNVRREGEDYHAPCLGCGRAMKKPQAGNEGWTLAGT